MKWGKKAEEEEKKLMQSRSLIATPSPRFSGIGSGDKQGGPDFLYTALVRP